MRLLLDTHAVLWWLRGDPKFSQHAEELISDPTNDILVSVVSLWVMLVKARVGKLEVDMQDVLTEMRSQGFTLLGLEPAHLLELARLPMTHKDPFDHLLIAQAIAEKAVFMSEDGHVPEYPVTYLKCSGAALPQRREESP